MKYDAIVIGGSFAGMSAAMMLARARRQVCVLDAGQPRNRFAEASHGFFGQDGAAPAEMLAEARSKLLAYPSVTLIEGRATHATGSFDAFEVRRAEGAPLSARRLVLAHGVTDVLPDLPGLRERWGKTVLHCPYCHGYEFADQRLGVLATDPMSALKAQLIAEWGPTTLFLDGQTLDEATRAKLIARGIQLEPARVRAVLGPSPTLHGVALEDGRTVLLDALYVSPRIELGPLAEQLGCAVEQGALGPMLRTDEQRLTTVPGVYAAGDIVRQGANATWAASDGVMAGAMLHHSLVFS